MCYYIRTTLERELNGSYNQITYKLIIDKEHKPIDSFIESLYQINDEDSVLMEDDLILCKDFVNRLNAVVEQYPNRIINFFWFPEFYVPTRETYQIAFNQCTFYPKGIAKQIADIMVTLPRNEGYKKNMYSLLEKEALKQLGIKVIQYRPCLVQHLDNDTLLFEKTVNRRRSPYFMDYLDTLGITYEEAKDSENCRKLIKLMREHFKELCKQKNQL